MGKLNQNLTPLFTTLKDVYAKRNITPFHVPGHKQGKGMDEEFFNFIGENPLKIDVTIFKMVDGLHHPKSCIKEAQELAADAYGAKKTFFAVNGTSGAINAMILSVVKAGEKILIPRNVHKSVSAGIILAGATPVYMNPVIDNELGIAHGVSPYTVEKMLELHPDAKAVLLINPTYYGIATDIQKIANIVHAHDIPLIVDEAHGPHLHFHEDLPTSAVDVGADICCQSTHKILGSMTQMSLLHINSDRIDVARVQQILSLLHTTSPSYPLMASLDCARRQVATKGRELLTKTIELANYARMEINKIPGIYSFGQEIVGHEGVFAFDPTKLTVSAKELGISGFDLEVMLVDEYDIQVEMADFYNVLGLVTIGDTEESINTLIAALKDISARFFDTKEVSQMKSQRIPAIPQQDLIPREAFYSETSKVPFKESLGKICAEMIMAYPPGIPIIIPGERISQEIIDYIEELREQKTHLQGMEDPELETIKIIEDEDAVYIFTEKMKSKIFGVPINLGANRSGIEFGIDVLTENFPDTFGEIEIIDIEKQREDFNVPMLKYKNTILNTCEKIAKFVDEAIEDGYRPITIGGDHSIALGTISGVAKTNKNLGVVWIDAHADMNTEDTTVSGNIHGMPLAFLQGIGDADMANCYFEGAKIDPKNVIILGARDIDVREYDNIEKQGIKVIAYDDVMRKGIDAVLDEIQDYLKVEDVHISFDIDSLNPKLAPGVSTPVKKGLDEDDMMKTFKFLFKNYFVTSVDIVEYNPIYDNNLKTAALVRDITDYMTNPVY